MSCGFESHRPDQFCSRRSALIHKIKIHKSYADAIVEGRKTFEVRLNDRGYNTGDFVQFQVVEQRFSVLCDTSHKLNDMQFVITYVYSGKGLDSEYVVFGIKPVEVQ